MALTTVFVTVGTTQFDKLIRIITSKDVLKILKTKGCRELVIQIGNGIYPKIDYDYEIIIKIFRFKENVKNDVTNASLIIGHGGAGTCLEALQAHKKLIVVVNDELMNNHQTELARKFYDEGYIYLASCTELVDILDSNITEWCPRPYGTGKVKDYVAFIDNLMGYV